MIQNRFVELLKDKINQSKNLNEETNNSSNEDLVENFLKELKSIDDDILQSDSKNMEFKKKVDIFQTGLELLGYKLPIHGVDGLFGPETAGALNEF